MAGLGSVAYAPLVLDGRWLPGVTVTTDRPAVACLASQYAGGGSTTRATSRWAAGRGAR